jgi:hypothetical protein
VTQPIYPQQPQPQPQPQPPTAKKHRWLAWIPLGVVVFLASCGAILGAIGGEDDSATTAQPTQSTKAATSKAPQSEPTQETVNVGEKVRDGGYQFTATKVTCGVKRVGDQYMGEKAQGQFCMVKLRVKNVSKEPINFSSENQALVDTKGKTYSPDDEAWIYVDDSDPFGEINPGNTMKTTVPFDVSKRAKPDYLLLKAGGVLRGCAGEAVSWGFRRRPVLSEPVEARAKRGREGWPGLH